MNQYIQTKEVEGEIAFRLSHDDDPQSPREYDPITHIAAWHKRYRLADEGEDRSPQAFLESVRECDTLMPLYMMDHGAVSLSLSPYSDPWDSGQVGFVLITPERVKAVGLDPDDTERVQRLAEEEIAAYSQYVNGDILCMTIHRMCHGQTLPTPELTYGGITDDDEQNLDVIALELCSLSNLAGDMTRERIAASEWTR